MNGICVAHPGQFMVLWKTIIMGFPRKSFKLTVLLSIAFKLLQSTICQVRFGTRLSFRLSTLGGVAVSSTAVIMPSSGQFSRAGAPEQAIVDASNSMVIAMIDGLFMFMNTPFLLLA